jgi:quinol monooxygenase YgiN
MQVTVFVYLHAHPSTRVALQTAVAQILAPTREEPGCLSVEAFCAAHDPQELITFSRWDNQAAYEHHTQMSHTVGFLERAVPLLDRPLRVSITRALESP